MSSALCLEIGVTYKVPAPETRVELYGWVPEHRALYHTRHWRQRPGGVSVLKQGTILGAGEGTREERTWPYSLEALL
jgi:hypothetical protein